MEAFAALLDRLYYTQSNLAKSALIRQYLAHTPDPERGWAIAALAGTLQFDLFKRHTVKQLIEQRVDPYLFELSYHYVGEMSETVAHLWPVSDQPVRLNRLPELNEIITHFREAQSREAVQVYLITLLDNMDASQRWALVKLGTRGLRVGVSARFLKKILAEYGDVSVDEIETLWHALEPPYTSLFAWLEGKTPRPDISDRLTYHPVMLAHPLEEGEVDQLHPDEWQAEWKYDGIRVQYVNTPHGSALFSRNGDDISHSFPDVLGAIDAECVLDGELLVIRNGEIGSFNELQQRLNKKKPSKKLMDSFPAGIVVYDALSLAGESMTDAPLARRREKLEQWVSSQTNSRLQLSESLPFDSAEALHQLREQVSCRTRYPLIEGLMLKRKTAPYVPGRPKGQWYKWKRDALLVDAVMMYAQLGHGKRSSFYSDYTFGVWHEGELLPLGKAYSGFTDEELKKLDKWIRSHTVGRFGPVREVAKELVLEIAFDSFHASPRHKSAVALRFPRIHRIRWDKPAEEADQLVWFHEQLGT